MKRKCICFILWVLLVALAYGGGYLCFAWPISNIHLSEEPMIIPVTAGKKNFILPETRLVTEIIDLKSGEKIKNTTSMPAVFLGFEKEELLSYLNEYMDNLSIQEREKGLVAYDLEAYSTEEIQLKKLYYPDENYHRYYMIYQYGRIVVYHSDKKTVYEYPDIKLYDLPLDIQCKVITGMEIKDDVELYNFLQNYSS